MKIGFDSFLDGAALIKGDIIVLVPGNLHMVTTTKYNCRVTTNLKPDQWTTIKALMKKSTIFFIVTEVFKKKLHWQQSNIRIKTQEPKKAYDSTQPQRNKFNEDGSSYSETAPHMATLRLRNYEWKLFDHNSYDESNLWKHFSQLVKTHVKRRLCGWLDLKQVEVSLTMDESYAPVAYVIQNLKQLDYFSIFNIFIEDILNAYPYQHFLKKDISISQG